MEKLTLGDKIRLARVEKRLTQQQLADLLGTKQKSISRYETNQVEPSISALQRIAQVLEKPISFFLEDENFSYSGRSVTNRDQDLKGLWERAKKLPPKAQSELSNFISYLEAKYLQK